MITCNEKEALNGTVHETLVCFPFLINEGIGKPAQTGQSCLHAKKKRTKMTTDQNLDLSSPAGCLGSFFFHICNKYQTFIC